MKVRVKIFAILAFCLVSTTPAKAWGGLRCNLDWGYMAAVYESYRYNYIADEGFRVEQHGRNFLLNSNGLVKMFIGTQVGSHTELGVFSGYEGIRQDRRIIPLGIRTNWLFRGVDADGPMCFLEGGAAFHNDCKMSGICGAGLGWHLQLDHGCELVFKMGVNLSGDHPAIKNVSTEDLMRSDYTYGGISLSVGISF